jgi:hypothetical protein
MSISERDFNAVAAANPKKKPRDAPFSLRLSFEEKALLRAAANGVPLGAYIKAKLFDEPLEKVRRRNTNGCKRRSESSAKSACRNSSPFASRSPITCS